MNHKAKTGIFLYLPIAGIFLFFVLYIFAASKYPGGSQADDFSIGFDWFHNYWCDLMKEVAYNESKNPARPIAIAATFLLSFSISLFSIQFPKYLPVSNFCCQNPQINQKDVTFDLLINNMRISESTMYVHFLCWKSQKTLYHSPFESNTINTNSII